MPRPHPSRCCQAALRLVLLASLLSACASAPPPVQSMRDPQADFNSFQSFAWDAGADSSRPVSILDAQIRAAIGGELQRKGYVEATPGSDPDLKLQYETAAAEMLKSKPFRIGVGVGGYGNSGGAGVGVSSAAADNVREGTLVLRVIDPRRNAEVWNGRVSRELSRDGPPDSDLVQSAVRELLQGFPSRGGELKPSG